MTVSDFFNQTGASFKSVVKVALLSRRCDIRPVADPARPLIVMANGPSLNTTINQSLDILKNNDSMSVNFAPLADVYSDIRPRFHVMADPVFFENFDLPNVRTLYDRLGAIDWPLQLLVPAKYSDSIPESVRVNSNITVHRFNFVGASGFFPLEKLLYSHRMAMPRPRNVLVPALMCGIWLGYKRIYIVGADHSWMQTISVDDDNNVVSIQPHFYKDDKSEQNRVDTAYRAYRLHQIVESFAIAFRSYHTLRRFADTRGVSVYNSTPGSFIDAFSRAPLPD